MESWRAQNSDLRSESEFARSESEFARSEFARSESEVAGNSDFRSEFEFPVLSMSSKSDPRPEQNQWSAYVKTDLRHFTYSSLSCQV